MNEMLTDRQQAARVRSWLRQYAPAAIVALAVGGGGYFGYAQWQERSDRRAAEASGIFEEFRSLLDSGNRESAEALRQRLVSDFPRSGYAHHARLAMAREYVESTRPSEAAEELEQLIAAAGDEDLRHLAHLRLARVYLYMDQPEEGLKALEAEVPSEAWKQLTEDVRGDLYRALGRFEEARSAYLAALEGADQVAADWIRMKLDYLGGKTASAADIEEDAAEKGAGVQALETVSASGGDEDDSVAAEEEEGEGGQAPETASAPLGGDEDDAAVAGSGPEQE